MYWWPNQLESIGSGACILIPDKHNDQDTFISSKTDQDTDQETWILISLNTVQYICHFNHYLKQMIP